MTPDSASASPILDAAGRPARPANDTGCPQCGAGPDKRMASCGFGVRRPVCTDCGWKWEDEVWRD